MGLTHSECWADLLTRGSTVKKFPLLFENFGRKPPPPTAPFPSLSSPPPSHLPNHFTMSADSSPLSSPPSSPGEMPEFFERLPSPLSLPSDDSPEPPSVMQSKSKKREPSPPHEEVLADNPDIAVSSDASITSWNTRLRLASRGLHFLLFAVLTFHRIVHRNVPIALQ
jgi:hypothetical protein